jgi:hypothetical protein
MDLAHQKVLVMLSVTQDEEYLNNESVQNSTCPITLRMYRSKRKYVLNEKNITEWNSV